MNTHNKIKEIFERKEIYIFSIITILFFGAFSILQYAPDTYSVFTDNLRNTVIHFLSCGRFVTGAFTYFFIRVLNLSNEKFYILSYSIAILCTIISLYRLNQLLKKDIKNEIVSMLVTILIIINPFSIELFMYVEKGIMIFSVLLCVLTVEQIEKFFNSKNKKSLIFAIIYMFIANCCYQGTVGVFVTISLIYVIKFSKNIKSFLINNIIIAITYGIPAAINFLLVRFSFNNARVNGEIILSESFSKLINGTKRMIIDAYDLLPKYFFLICIFILLGIIIYKAISQKENRNKKIIQIAGGFYLLAGSWFVTVAPQMLQDTNSIWFVARSSYPMASIIGILIFYIFMQFDISNLQNKVMYIFMTLLLIIQYNYFITFTTHNYIGNYMDKTITLEIYSMIQEYERETGNKIEKISIYKDASSQYSYPGLKASGDMNTKAYAPEWCVSRILELYTDRDFEVIENDTAKKEEFSKSNWEYFNEGQVIFEENVMHLCVF